MTGRVLVLVLGVGTYGQLGCSDLLGADFDKAHLCDGSEEGGCCPCGDGLVCINETCVACGGPDEACCPGHDCDPGSACFGPADQPEACTTSCGYVGADCCEGTCPAGGVCISGTCEPSQSDPDPCGGSDKHFIYAVDEFQCATEKKEFWADPDTVQACADEQLAAYPAGFTIGPVDLEPCAWACQYSDLADETGSSVWVCAYSEQDFDACTSSMCPDCIYTDEEVLDCAPPPPP